MDERHIKAVYKRSVNNILQAKIYKKFLLMIEWF